MPENKSRSKGQGGDAVPESVDAANVVKPMQTPDSAYQSIFASLNHDLEEKIYQLSQARLIAEAVTRDLQDHDYYTRLCAECLDVFEATICAYFRYRRRGPSGWWVVTYASRDGMHHPSSELIPHEEQGLFSLVANYDEPVYIEKLEDEQVFTFWQYLPSDRRSLLLFPLTGDANRLGALMVLDPDIRLSEKNILPQLEIIGSLLNSGVNNRLLYETLLASEEEFRDLFENASDMVLVVYPDGVIREGNRAVQSTLGLEANPSGRRLEDLVDESSRADLRRIVKELLSGRDVNNEDLILRRADGNTLEAEISGNVRKMHDGRVGVMRLYMRDVTKRRQEERRRREMELELMRQSQLAQVGIYISGIAHNLQNPMAGVLGQIQVLKLKGQGGPELEAIERSATKAKDIITNVLNKVRREQDTAPQEIDINELLRSELSFLEANPFYKYRVQKRFEFGEDLPPVRGAYGDFSQVLMNLVNNALDAMKESKKRELTVKTYYDPENRQLCVVVKDTGSGITKEVGEQIFQPFFTTKPARRDEITGISSGSGLGLAHSLALLKPYGGTITFETELGRGTIFTVCISAAKMDELHDN